MLFGGHQAFFSTCSHQEDAANSGFKLRDMSRPIDVLKEGVMGLPLAETKKETRQVEEG